MMANRVCKGIKEGNRAARSANLRVQLLSAAQLRCERERSNVWSFGGRFSFDRKFRSGFIFIASE